MFGDQTTSTLLSATAHPFYPAGIELVGYLANDKDTVTLLGIALAGLVVICSATWAVVSRISPRVRTVDRLAILWFMSSKTRVRPVCSTLC
jgi:cholestenol delta-isomerase